MIRQFTRVWDTKAEAWGEVVGIYPTEEDYNAEAKFFSVDPRPYGEPRKVNAKNLQVLEDDTWIEVLSGHTDEALPKTYFAPFGRLPYPYQWDKMVKPAPKDYTPPEFKVGDLVQLVFAPEYYAVIKSIPDLYVISAFKKGFYSKFLETGLPDEDVSRLSLELYRLSKLDLPAPRMLMSESARDRIRYTFKQNLNSRNSPSPRFNIRYKQSRQVHGKVLASAVNAAKKEDTEFFNDNLSEVIEAFNSLHASNLDQVWELMRDFCNSHGLLQKCDECDAIVDPDNMSYSEWHETYFCESCRDHYTYSEMMNGYISGNEAISYYGSVRAFHRGNTDGYVTREWAERDSDTEIYDGSAVDSVTYYELRQEDDEDEEDEDEDEDDGSNDGLNGYHNSNRNWEEQWENKTYLPLGLEIEVYSEDRRAAVMAVRDVLSDAYLEKDGSIDDDYGFEVITQPYGKDEWAVYGKPLLNALKDNGACAYNRPAGKGYGIHININRKYLSPLQEMRMFMFLAANENSNFVKAIAQRSSVYAAAVNIGAFKKLDQRVNQAGGLTSHFKGYTATGVRRYNKKINGRGKYAPINLHYDRMEIRIFQSTLNGTSFNKNLEFTWALIEWTSTKAATGYSWAHVDFVKWLAKRPHAEKDYPSLVAFLRKDEYALIDADPVENTWKEFIPKETRRSVLQLVVNAFDEEEVETEVAVVVPTMETLLNGEDEAYALAA